MPTTGQQLCARSNCPSCGKPGSKNGIRAGHQRRRCRACCREWRDSPVKPPPATCPHCLGRDTIRHGHDRRGRQKHFCHDCRREWVAGASPRQPRERKASKPRDPRQWPKLICCHCGSCDCKPRRRRKRSGIQAQCRACGRNFTQGGPEDLRRYSVCLRERVRVAGYRGEAADEVLADAIVDVLSGNGYCWNVPLKRPAALSSARGDWGLGSDHPAMREQQGQRW